MDLNKGLEEIKSLRYNNQITEETMNDTIVGIRHEMAGKELDNELKRSKIDLNETEKEAVREGIKQSWEKIKIDWKNADTNERNMIINDAVYKLKENRPSIGDMGGSVLRNTLRLGFNILDKLDKKFGTDIEGMKKALEIK